MKILGIETSCDDTSIALISGDGDCVRALKESNASQIDIHKAFGGIVPEVAARAHTETIIPLLKEIFDFKNPPDAIAVTSGPGLITSLIVGVETAKTLSALLNIPLISVNHMEGHIYANWVQAKNTQDKPILFPVLALIVSGGHTELIIMHNHLSYKKIGWTQDDAAGETFDKIGKLLGFDYPGGPKISQLAQSGNPHAIKLPRPMIDSGNLHFSFAGLKTAAKIYLEKHEYLLDKNNTEQRADFCASFEQAIVETLISKTLDAIAMHHPQAIILGGGVSANAQLRTQMKNTLEQTYPEIYFKAPDITCCTDNATMIAAAGYFKARENRYINWQEIHADPAWELSH